MSSPEKGVDFAERFDRMYGRVRTGGGKAGPAAVSREAPRTERRRPALDVTPDGKPLRNLSDVAPEMGLSYKTLHKYVVEGRLHAYKIAGRWKVTDDDIRGFWERSSSDALMAEKPRK